VVIAGGDTKVVEHGKADRMYITTAGIGRPIPGDRFRRIGASRRQGAALRPIGDHGITILLARGELDLEADLCSDTRSVLPLVEALARGAAPGIRWMRDPTRGGVATSLNELARDCGLGVCSPKTHPDPRRWCAALASCWASIRCTSPTKASFWRWSPRVCRRRARRATRCAEVRPATGWAPVTRVIDMIGEIANSAAGDAAVLGQRQSGVRRRYRDDSTCWWATPAAHAKDC
jgi:hypothetical protein